MNPVIKPSLVVGLVGALVASALLSGALIVKLGRFDDAKLKAEIESFTRQKDTLRPRIVNGDLVQTDLDRCQRADSASPDRVEIQRRRLRV